MKKRYIRFKWETAADKNYVQQWWKQSIWGFFYDSFVNSLNFQHTASELSAVQLLSCAQTLQLQ